MNARTYPRNSALAFPKTCDYACAIERPMDREDRIVMWGCAIAAAALCVIFWVWG